MKPLTIVFAGTPAFTLPCLDALIQSPHELKAVYTQPDRPAGRGRIMQASAVKHWAQSHQLPILQPLNFKTQDSIDELRALSPDILIVIAYGLILPPAVLNLPRLGCINVHASLLPRWRGASPIQQAVLHGDKVTGITIMQMDAGMDTGHMLMQTTCPIEPNDTSGSLHDKLAMMASDPLLATLELLSENIASPQSQDHALVTYAPKIKKEDALINWQTSAIEIDQQIRAYNPWPIAYTHIESERIRVYQASIVTEPSTHKPGTILSIDKQGILVATGNQLLRIEMLQFPGGKVISVADYLHAERPLLRTHLVLQ